MKWLVAVCLSVVVSTFVLADDVAVGPAREIPELQPLNRFAGSWDTRMTVRVAGTPGEPASVQGTSKAEWVHGGRFLRQAWSYRASGTLPAGSGSTMMTYDPEAKVYRSWMFFSSGATLESQGRWNPQSNTFTWTGRNGRSTTTATFKEDGTEHWSMVEKDATGKVLSEASGVNTRRKN